MRRKGKALTAVLLEMAMLTAVLLWFMPSSAVAGGAPVSEYRVVESFPHDRQAFTQGLAWDGDALLESTGLYGKSSLRRVDLRSGKVRQEHRLGKKFFGEGAVVVGERVIQLTWRSGTGFVYDRSSFKQLATFPIAGEGWGITWDGKRLIMSDGSATLRFLDPVTFRETGRIQVRDGGDPWTDRIARIDPGTGRVTGWVDLEGILSPFAVGQKDVLNGIAWDPEGRRLFVTGKRWPRIFEIEVIPKPR
jgi:glutamine cyclotransferase